MFEITKKIMEHTEMKCTKCGGVMKKMDEHTMKCEGCGATMPIEKKEAGE